jgi:GT2 family glycosyltransferase
MPSPPTVSVVVPAWNAAATLPACLAALRACDPAPDELIVVDDGSTDETAALARSAGCTVLSHPRSQGPAQARNRGATEATGELLVFVDADVVVPPDALGRAAAVLASPAARAEQLHGLSAVYSATSRVEGFGGRYLNRKQRAFQLSQPRLADTAWTAFFAVWRARFWAAGGFDTDQRHPAADDLVLGCRLKAAGSRTTFLPELEVEHLKELDAAGVLRFHYVHAREWSRAAPRYRGLVSDKPRQSLRPVGNTVIAAVLVPQLGLLLLGPLGLPPVAATVGLAALWNRRFLQELAADEGWRFAALALPLALGEGLASAAGALRGSVRSTPRRVFSALRRAQPEAA